MSSRYHQRERKKNHLIFVFLEASSKFLVLGHWEKKSISSITFRIYFHIYFSQPLFLRPQQSIYEFTELHFLKYNKTMRNEQLAARRGLRGSDERGWFELKWWGWGSSDNAFGPTPLCRPTLSPSEPLVPLRASRKLCGDSRAEWLAPFYSGGIVLFAQDSVFEFVLCFFVFIVCPE